MIRSGQLREQNDEHRYILRRNDGRAYPAPAAAGSPDGDPTALGLPCFIAGSASFGLAQAGLVPGVTAGAALRRTQGRLGIALAREAGTLPLEGKTHKELGIVLSKLGHHSKAMKELGRALALLRRLGYRPQEAETLLALGDALSAQGMEDEACDARQQAFTILSAFRREVMIPCLPN